MNNLTSSTALHYALSRGRGGIHYLGFHGFWLRGEFGAAQAGLHHSPALSLLCESPTTPHRSHSQDTLNSHQLRFSLLQLRLRHRLLGLGSWTLPSHLREKLDESFCRTK